MVSYRSTSNGTSPTIISQNGDSDTFHSSPISTILVNRESGEYEFKRERAWTTFGHRSDRGSGSWGRCGRRALAEANAQNTERITFFSKLDPIPDQCNERRPVTALLKRQV